MSFATIEARGMDPGPVLEWNALFLQVARSGNLSPTLCSRNAAVLHVAIYEAVHAIVGTHLRYRVRPTPPDPVDLSAAAAGAGHEVLLSLHPSFAGAIDQLLHDWQARSPATHAVTNGLDFGRAVARRILELRAEDGSSTQVAYIPSDVPGEWRRTPPFYRPPLDPHWRLVRPFVVDDIEPYAAPPPPRLDSPEYARDFEEVRRLGSKNSAGRSPDESLAAVFWSDFSYTVTPPGHWQQVATFLIRQQGTDLPGAARLMALVTMAQADAAIACWETKYRYNSWRPITAIRRAAEDGNPETAADPAWESFLTTPNFPEYVSGHAAFSQASADVIRGFYGTDALRFTVGSDSVPGVQRSYENLQHCVEEVCRSRIHGGIHFPFASREGKKVGARVAAHVLLHGLIGRGDLPLVRVEVIGEKIRLRVHGEEALPLALEASTDLVRWEPLHVMVPAPGGVAFEDSPRAGARRFYRVRRP